MAIVNALITGGCGFIGSNFIRYLLKTRSEVRIVNMDRLTYAGNLANLADVERDFSDRYRFVRGDIGDREQLKRIFRRVPVDWVVNFAAESHVDRSIMDPDIFIKTNVYGTFNLLEQARKHWLQDHQGKKPLFLHISTDEVYGSLGETGAFTEESPYDPSSPYSASKASSDHMVNAYYRTYGLPAIITNCSNNYGPYQFPEKLIPLMIQNAVKGIELPLYGDGENVRDWLYVEDHCRAILMVLENGIPGESYNIGGHCERKNKDVVGLICDMIDEKLGLPKEGPRRHLIRFISDRPGHDRRYALDITKIKNGLGWQPRVTFEQGIRTTIDWYLENPEWVQEILNGTYREYYRKQYGKKRDES